MDTSLEHHIYTKSAAFSASIPMNHGGREAFIPLTFNLEVNNTYSNLQCASVATYSLRCS
jgi:hypothetical protein